MRTSSPFFRFNVKAIALAAAAIVIIHLAANVTVTTAQQEQEQQQPLTSQPTVSSATQNGTTATTRLLENTNDNFRVQIPEGWVIRDVNNTGYALAAEVTQGYGILAQLCPEGEEEGQQQQQGALTNASGSSISGSCKQQPQGEIIHIIRYPNLGARLGIAVSDIRDMIPDSVLEYEIQKLREVGYRDINIMNSTDTTVNIHYTTTEDVPEANVTVPAKLVEMAYSTSSAPNEIRRGYLILTATNATPPNLETVTGYSIFYEGASGTTAAEQTTTPPSGNSSLPAPVRQVFGSFELIASEETVQDILAAITARQAVSIEPNDQVEEDEDEEEDDE